MTAANVMDIIPRLPGCAGQAADAMPAYTQVKMEDASSVLKIPKSECPDFWTRLPRHKWPKSWANIEDPVVPLERNVYGHPLAGVLRERQLEEVLLRLGWEKRPNWECLLVHQKQELFLSVYVDDIEMAGRTQNMAPMWKKLMELFDLDEPTSFLHHENFACTQRNEDMVVKKEKFSNHEFLIPQLKKKTGWEKPHAKTVAWSHDMEGHAEKCVER